MGEAMVPDIAPGPPQDARMTPKGERWIIRFTTFLANVETATSCSRQGRTRRLAGRAGCSLLGERREGVPHSRWARLGRRRAQPLARRAHRRRPPRAVREGRPAAAKRRSRPRRREGRLLLLRPLETRGRCRAERRLPHEECGTQNDVAIGMGLMWGWMDIYGSKLPGQAIDVTDVPDGRYRLWINLDRSHWFQEQRRDNNVTWADFNIVTSSKGSRDVRNLDSGPPDQSRDLIRRRRLRRSHREHPTYDGACGSWGAVLGNQREGGGMRKALVVLVALCGLLIPVGAIAASWDGTTKNTDLVGLGVGCTPQYEGAWYHFSQANQNGWRSGWGAVGELHEDDVEDQSGID